MRTAPRMWFLSYAAVSSPTSTSTTLGSSRCASTQSASTRTLLLGICLLLFLYRVSTVYCGFGDVTNDRPPEHTDQSKMDLAAEAVVERRVEERRAQCERRRHHTQWCDASEITDGTDQGKAEADALREPWRSLGLQFDR